MPIIKFKGTWKPVEMDGAVIAGDDAFKFLSSFEELVDDTPPTKPNKKKKNNMAKQKPVSKGAAEEGEEKVEGSGEEDAQDVQSTKAKKRKSKSKGKADDASQPKKPKAPLAPESPGCDTRAWSECGLEPELVSKLGGLGFEGPTEIQALALPAAVRDRLDVLGAAETGSGKTLAFGLPIVNRLLLEQKEGELKTGLRALILSPTRELALQIKAHIAAVLPVGLSVAAVVGGLAPQKQQRLLKRSPQILVGTPGRLWAFIQAVRNSRAHIAAVLPVGLSVAAVVGGLAPQKQQRLLKRSPQILVGTPGRLWAFIQAVRNSRAHIAAVLPVGLSVAAVVGGLAPQKQQRLLKRSPQILVGTPGRLWAFIQAVRNSRAHIAAVLPVGLSVAAVVGGLAPQKQQRLLKRSPQILVGTPGRLWAFIQAVRNSRGHIAAVLPVGLSVAAVVGGLAPQKQQRLLKRSPQILVGTPGRLWAFIQAVRNSRGHIAAVLPVGLSVAAVFGGLAPQKQQRLLKRSPQILVGTPGRLWAFIQASDEASYMGSMENLNFLVVDETDRMVEKGHFEELRHILTYVKSKS